MPVDAASHFVLGGVFHREGGAVMSEELTGPVFPPGWGLVDGKPFTADLGAALSGQPIELPEEWKLPKELRGGVPSPPPKRKRKRNT